MRLPGVQSPAHREQSHPWKAVAATLAAGVGLVGMGCNRGDSQAIVTPPPAEVTVSKPLVQPVTDALEYTGTTTALESVEVRARVTGFLERVHFEPRAKVDRGDVLFTIDPRPFEHALATAQADLDAKKARLVKADFDAQKVTRLFKSGQAAPDEFTRDTAEAEALRAAVAAAEAEVADAQLRLDWCSVTAPIPGLISRNLIDPGNIVTADTSTLATIVNDDAIYAYFNMSEGDVLTLRGRIHAGQTSRPAKIAQSGLDVPLQLALMTDEGFPYEGRIDYAATELDSSTGTIQARGRFPNPDHLLLPGMFVRIRIPLGVPYDALTVTERALGSDQGQRYLLVVNDQNRVEYRPVEVGALRNGLRVIKRGIQPDDRIIVNGMQRVRPGVVASPVDVEMPVGPAAAAGRTRPMATRPSSN